MPVSRNKHWSTPRLLTKKKKKRKKEEATVCFAEDEVTEPRIKYNDDALLHANKKHYPEVSCVCSSRQKFVIMWCSTSS